MPKSQSLLLLPVLLVCILLGYPQQPSAGSPQNLAAGQGGRKAKYVPGRLLVRFRTADQGTMDAAHQRSRATAVKAFPSVPNLQLIELPDEVTVEQAAAGYRKNPAVLYAEPDYLYQAEQQTTPNDPRFGEMWDLHNTGQVGGTPDADIDAPEAWAMTTGSSNVVVGVTDSGIDYNHPDLQANIFQNTADCNSNGQDDDGNGFADDCFGINPVYGTSDPMDDAGHGTHVAGTIGAEGNNGVGVVGVNWNVRLLACKFLDSSGFGSTSGAITCLQYFATMWDRGVNIVATNNSWGGGPFSSALRDAIDQHRQRGILFVASAGNAGTNNDTAPHYPSDYYLPNVISVTGTNRNDLSGGFNVGRYTVHVAAPGVTILSTLPGGSYGTASGTSMASPHVAGAAALLKAQNPSRDWRAIKNLLLAGGNSVPGAVSTISQKRLNVHGAMTCTNSVVQSRVLPVATTVTAALGVPVDLAVVHVNCATPNGSVQVSVNGGAQSITLMDDGAGADQEVGDGVYSGQWVPAGGGAHTLTFPGGDVVNALVLSPYVHAPAPFGYRSITGQALNMPDDGSVLLTLPFPIQFGGGSFTSWHINDNGNVTFSGEFSSFSNQPLPVAAAPTLVAPFWDDLIPGGDVFYEVRGSPPNREMVVEWRHYFHWECAPGDAITVQAVFFEGSSDILFNYSDVVFSGLRDCSFADFGGSATVGVQVSPGVASQYSFASPALADGMSILWQLGTPVPSITGLAPFDAVAGDPGFTLKVKGKDFLSNSVVRWNGSDRPTSFVNSIELTAVISASDVAAVGTAQVTIFSPPPAGGGESAPASFEILATRDAPMLNSVTPSSLLSGTSNAVLNATGTGFHSASVLRWNGVDQVTTVTNNTSLSAEISVSDLAVLGTAQVTVFNPPPGGGESNALSVDVNNPVPVPALLFPDPVAAGGPDFTLLVIGDGFSQTSVVRWNGSDRPTTFLSSFFLEATIAAADIATAGTAQIAVFNPAPGGGLSASLPLQVVPPAPNDHFANSIVISSVPYSHSVATEGATPEAADPVPCGIGSTENSVWYTFTVPAGATINVNTFGSGYDTVLSAWTGGPGSFVSVGCNDDTPGMGLASSLRITRTTQTTVHFMVTDYFSGGGALVFNLDVEPSFTMTSSAGSATVQRGQAATFTLTLNPQFGTMGSQVNFSCLNPPFGVTCSFAPPTVTLGPAPVTTTLTISTSGLARLAPQPDSAPVFAAWLFLPALGLLAAPLARPRTRRMLLRFSLLLIVLAALGGGQAGCGGGSAGGGGVGGNPPPQQMNITVQAVSGMAMQQTVITLTVR